MPPAAAAVPLAAGAATAGTAAAGTAAAGAGAAAAGTAAAGAGAAGAGAAGGGMMSGILPAALGSMMSTMGQPGQGIPMLLGGAAQTAMQGGGAAVPQLGGSALGEAMSIAPPMMPAPMSAPMPGMGAMPPVPITPGVPNNFDFGSALKQGLAGSATAMDLALKYKMANGQRPSAPAPSLRGTATPPPQLGQKLAAPVSPMQRFSMMLRGM